VHQREDQAAGPTAVSRTVNDDPMAPINPSGSQPIAAPITVVITWAPAGLDNHRESIGSWTRIDWSGSGGRRSLRNARCRTCRLPHNKCESLESFVSRPLPKWPCSQRTCRWLSYESLGPLGPSPSALDLVRPGHRRRLWARKVPKGTIRQTASAPSGRWTPRSSVGPVDG